MAEVDKKVIAAIERGSSVYQVLDKEGNPTGVFKGPWLDKYYDNYTEALKENQNAWRIQDLKSKGLNEHAQTPEQEADFKRRQKISEEKKKRAEALNETLKLNK